jgi:hypothetical protein
VGLLTQVSDFVTPALAVGCGATTTVLVFVALHIAETPTEYVTTKVPGPDTDGQNELDDTPVPLNVPPV